MRGLPVSARYTLPLRIVRPDTPFERDTAVRPSGPATRDSASRTSFSPSIIHPSIPATAHIGIAARRCGGFRADEPRCATGSRPPCRSSDGACVLIATCLRALAASILLGTGAAASGADGMASAPVAGRHLSIASEGARPPDNYFDGDRLAGFEIDLGRDLCRRMAASCTFVAQDWDSMIPGLLAHRYDAIMAAMEITPQRQAQIAFSTPYVRLPSAFLVRKTTDLRAATPAAMANRTVGVEAGGPHQAFLEKTYPGARIRRYGSLSDAILDLEAGRVDAAIGDKDAIVTFLMTRRDAACCKILADVPRDPAFFGDGIGVGLRKDDAALLSAFDRALAECRADGTFASIAARYFTFPID